MSESYTLHRWSARLQCWQKVRSGFASFDRAHEHASRKPGSYNAVLVVNDSDAQEYPFTIGSTAAADALDAAAPIVPKSKSIASLVYGKRIKR